MWAQAIYFFAPSVYLIVQLKLSSQHLFKSHLWVNSFSQKSHCTLFSSVNYKMPFQSVFDSESLFTEVTLERFFSSVNVDMSLQMAFPNEFHFTDTTLESPFSSVNFEMDCQMASSGKSLVTAITCERFFVGFFGFNHFYRFSIFNLHQMITVEESWRLSQRI